MNIVLIGFRCTGKTAVGKALAEHLKLEFIDADDYLEKKIGYSIRDIFVKQGESSFRLMEAESLSELARLDGKVIAAGGGAVLWYKNIRNLKRNAMLVLLEADPVTVFERLRRDPRTPTQRPALSRKDMYEEIVEQMELRRPYYSRAADHVVDTTAKTLEMVLEEVMSLVRRKQSPDAG
ncbi:MAG: shikimate kinase [Planctomycetes bacterium]|nr:shikimate kinase [Planctomycetota bacterium]